MAERVPLSVTVEKSASATVLTPSGEISYHEAPTFRTFIKQAYDQQPALVVIDMSQVPYMSTPGVATLVEALQMSRRGSTGLVLCGLNDKVADILRISKLEKLFKIVPTRQAALG